MAGSFHLKRNDIVIPIRGKSASSEKTGKVLQVIPSKQRAVVEGINLVKRHTKKSQDNPQGGIVEKEASISISNLMLYCPQCKRGVRISRVREAGRSVRKCKKCGHPFDE